MPFPIFMVSPNRKERERKEGVRNRKEKKLGAMRGGKEKTGWSGDRVEVTGIRGSRADMALATDGTMPLDARYRALGARAWASL